MTLRHLHLSAALCGLILHAPAASLWIEGEAPTKSSALKHNWYDAVKKDALSGGGWLSHYGEQPGEAGYDFEVAEAGSYAFFARLNPVASEPKWRLDGGSMAGRGRR